MNGRAPNWPHIGLALVVIGALIAAPQILTGGVAQNLAILSILYAVVASNWDLTLGYAGIFNFAHVAFFGIGSYVAAISTLQFGVPVWWDLALAVVVVMVVSGVVSSLALRLRGIYVALVTFAVTQLCVALINSQKDITGGPVGLIGVPDLQIGSLAFGSDARAYFYAAEILLLASTIGLRLLVSSNFGLSLVALRDNESYAVSRGMPARRQRVLAMIASSIPTSLAGCLYALFNRRLAGRVFVFSDHPFADNGLGRRGGHDLWADRRGVRPDRRDGETQRARQRSIHGRCGADRPDAAVSAGWPLVARPRPVAGVTSGGACVGGEFRSQGAPRVTVMDCVETPAAFTTLAASQRLAGGAR